MAQKRKTNIPQRQNADVLKSRTYNWKDHPFVVAVTTGVSTIGFAVLIYEKVIIPTYTTTLVNQVASLTAEVSSLRESKENADKTITLLKSQKANLDQKLAESQNANLFSFGNPYPVGLGKVRVGDPISSLEKIYSDKDIKKDKAGYWTVDSEHKVFNHIVYYYDDETTKKPITQIFFQIDYPLSVDKLFLQNKLTEALGVPKPSKNDDVFMWTTQAKVSAYLLLNNDLILIDKNFIPGFWHEK